MNYQVKQFWDTMAAQSPMFRGYSEIGLRMLWKVCTDGRMFRHFLRIDEPVKADPPKPPVRELTRIERYQIRINLLRNELTFEKSMPKRKLMQAKICHIKSKMRALGADVPNKKKAITDMRAYKRKYNREWMRRKRAAMKKEG